MKKLSIGITLLLFTCIFLHAQQTPQQGSGPEVKTASGIVRGVNAGDVAVFQRYSLCRAASRCESLAPTTTCNSMERRS